MKSNANPRTLVSIQILAIALLTLSVSATAWAGQRTLLNFNGSNGNSPGSLIADSAGNLYGFAVNGGTGCGPGCGLVFKLANSSGHWTKTILHEFKAGNDGAFPSSLIVDSSGNLYGTTSFGGGRGGLNCESFGCGIVFRLTPAASGPWPEKVLYRFSGGDGAGPNALAFDSFGNLFGTTPNGGSGGALCGINGGSCGVVFELTPTSSGLWTLTTIRAFLDLLTDAPGPVGLTSGAEGTLYGISGAGGSHGVGSVFQLVPGSGGWTFSIIHSFGTGDGIFPNSRMIIDALGNLYGTTPEGGANNEGIVFELSPGSGGVWSENILYSFQAGVDGKVPEGQLTFDVAGNLYGTTFYGGGTAGKCTFGCGATFKLTPTTSGPWTETLSSRFVSTNGGHPDGGLVLDIDGNLYGTATIGGTANEGVLFELTP